MRTRTTILIGALLLASTGVARAQQFAPATPGPLSPKVGQVNFGFRADSLTGDEARYNRFRDYREGVFVDQFRLAKETESWLFQASANNVGYRDQRYAAAFSDIGRFTASFTWDQVPLFLAADSRSLYTNQGNGVLAIDPAIRLGIQNATAQGNAARDAAIANALASFSKPYELRSRRDIGAFDMTYNVNRDVDLKLNVQSAKRSGNQVMTWGLGTSPGLNPAVEMGVPMDDRTTDVKGMLEFANAKGLATVGYNASWYENGIPLVRFDNPLRAVDISGGASAGQAVMWPSNTSFAVIANGAYRLAPRTRASAALSIGRWTQDETLAPATINTALVAPPLLRQTADTRADIVSMVYNFNSRPVQDVWLNARFRYYDYDNKSAHWESRALVGDWALGTALLENEPASFKRQTFEMDASFTPLRYLAFGAGYGREQGDRTFRIFEKTVDNSYRVSVDSTGNQYFSVRTKYEFSTREGEGFDVHLLEHVGEQPGMRHFDIANRDRSRLTTSFVVTPVAVLSLNASAGFGKDDYADSGFGLRDNENRFWSAGFDIAPVDTVSFGVNYGYEKLTAFQYSRQNSLDPATPAGQAQFADPIRDWWLDTDDIVRSVGASLDLIKALPKTDIRFSYDLSDGKATYVYGLPAGSTIFTTVPLQQLAPVKNRLTGGRADVRYYLRPNVAVGVVYHYEQYRVNDFALGPETLNRPDALNATTGLFASTLYAGYLYRPYTAHTGWLRLTYLW